MSGVLSKRRRHFESLESRDLEVSITKHSLDSATRCGFPVYAHLLSASSDLREHDHRCTTGEPPDSHVGQGVTRLSLLLSVTPILEAG